MEYADGDKCKIVYSSPEGMVEFSGEKKLKLIVLVKNPYVKFILKGQGIFSLDANKILRLQVTLNSRYAKNVIRYSLLKARRVTFRRKPRFFKARFTTAPRFLFFFVLSGSRPKLSLTANCLHRMMSSSANYRPFLSSFRYIPPPSGGFCKLPN